MNDLKECMGLLQVENDKLRVKLAQHTKDYAFLEVLHDFKFDNLSLKQRMYTFYKIYIILNLENSRLNEIKMRERENYKTLEMFYANEIQSTKK